MSLHSPFSSSKARTFDVTDLDQGLAPSFLETPISLLGAMRQADRPSLINLAAAVPSNTTLPLKDLEVATTLAYQEGREKVFCYQSPEGDWGLRQVLAERMKARGVNVHPEKIIVTTGCTQALNLMVSLWVKPGDIVACEAPCYYGTLELLGATGAKILEIPTDPKTGVLLDEAERLLKKWRPVCLVLCSTLSNPSGATIPVSSRKALVEICRSLNIKIIEDDLYADLSNENTPAPLLSFDDGSCVAYVTSFSKSVAPGLRTGFVLAGSSFEECAALKCRQDIHSSVVSQAIVKTFIQQGFLEKHLAHLRQIYVGRRHLGMQAIQEFFPKGTLVVEPSGGYILWVRLPRKVDLKAIQDEALMHQIIFCSGDTFFVRKPKESYMRINCAKASEEELGSALKKLGEIVSKVC